MRDADDNGIFGLNENNFAISENGMAAAPVTVTALTGPEKQVQKVDIVFVVDTSDSMIEEWNTVCGSISDIVRLLAAQEIDVSYKIYGLLKALPNSACSEALTQVVYNGAMSAAKGEDWGPGTTWAALYYPWRQDAARIVIPISDENAYDGTPETQADLQSIQEAIQASVLRQVAVYPFYSYNSGTYILPGVKEEAEALANGTGGKAFLYQDSSQVINDIVYAAKRSVSDYLLTYTTPDATRDGTIRNIIINTLYSAASGTGAGGYSAPLNSQVELVLNAVTLSNNNPLAGETVAITADIGNLGGVGAQNILVRFYDGDPSSGIQFGGDLILSNLPPAGTIPLTVEWFAVPGAHTITVFVDPLSAISESDKSNNIAIKTVSVPGTELPELGVSHNDIVFSKSSPAKGDAITINTTIHNTGVDAYNVLVLTYLGDPANGGIQIGSKTLSYLASSSAATVQTPWTVDRSMGAYDIYIWIDPFNIVSEVNKNDNIALNTVTIGQKQIVANISTDKLHYPASSTVGITLSVKNNSDTRWSGTGEIYIEDHAGNRAAPVTTFAVNDLKPASLSEWSYRIPVSITAQWDMKDALSEVVVDFTQVLQGLGLAGKTIDMNSIRVLELDVISNVLGEKQARSLFQSGSVGKVTWLVDGLTPKNTTRYFSLYFDTIDHGSKEPSANTNFPVSGRLVAFSDDTGNIYVVENNGNGTFGTPKFIEDISTSSDRTRGLALDDFNGDGFVDIVTGSGSNGEIYYYQNKADGSNTFNPKVKIGAINTTYFIIGMAAADFNKDGNKDFVVSGDKPNLLYIFMGNGNGTFTQTTLTVPSGTHYFRGKAAADMDQDGNIDLVVNSVDTSNSSSVYLYKGNGDGTFKPPVQLSTASGDSWGLVTGDFDEDGKDDMIVNRGSSNAYFIKGNGDGAFGTPSLIAALKSNSSAAYAAGDFNNDGHLDVIAAEYGTVAFYPGNGKGGFGQKTVITTYSSTMLGVSSSPALPEVHPVLGTAEAVPSQSFNVVWNTGSIPSGGYQVRVTLSEGAGVISDGAASFSIMSDMNVSSTVVADKMSYSPNETATLTSVITSQSAKYILEGMTVKLVIEDRIQESGVRRELFTESKTISTLMPGATFTFKDYWSIGTNASGTYPVTLTVRDSTGTIIATGTQTLTITSIIKPTSVLKGLISAGTQELLSGQTATLSYTVTNIGNADLQNMTLTVLTVNVSDQTVYDAFPFPTTLAMGGTAANTVLIDTTRYTAKDYLVILRANIAGTEETLAGTYFRIEGAPSAPSLAGPAAGSDVLTFAPLLSVNNASDPNDDKLTYEFELYTDSGLTNLIAGSGTLAEQTGITNWTVPLTLTENQTYYWRARVYDNWLYGPWMAPASFRVNTVNDPPTEPLISSPAEGSQVSTTTPVLVVTNATDPDSPSLTYNFDVALDPGFTQIVATTTGVMSSQTSTVAGQGTTSWQVPTNLIENTWYYWRAQADDWFITGPWSATASFFVNTTNEAPTMPVIQTPVNGSTIAALETDVTIINSTDPDSNVISYFFEIDTVPTFDSPNIIRSGVIAQGQATTTWHATGLKEDTQYSVRVKASDGQADSPWSSTVGFFANAVNEPPTTPILANPSNGSGVTVFFPTLSIHNATDPDRDVLTYEFEVYSNADLTTLVTSSAGVRSEAGGGITSWTVPVSLTENLNYYWRARAFDGKLDSPWMPQASFMVNTANDAPGAPTLSAPANNSTVTTLTPLLAVVNATDPDSQSLTYDFEVYVNSTLVTAISGVPANSAGITSGTLGTPLTDNTVYQWRTRAFDGNLYGPWTSMANFTVHLPQTGITATIDFDPNTLNKSSNGTWVVVYIELPADYKPADIDIASVKLEGTIPAEPWPYAIGDYDKDGIPDLMVKFRRSDVIKLLPNGDQVTVHVTGKVGTMTFEGVDIIRVLSENH